MCRMIAAIGTFSASALIDGFLAMAQDRTGEHEHNHDRRGRFLHDEGWGISYVDNDRMITKRFTTPAWADPELERFRGLETPLLVLHARKSTGAPVAVENTHPFAFTHPLLGEGSFCHNGTVHQPYANHRSECTGETDTECYMRALLHSIDNDPERDIEAFTNTLTSFTGANAILAIPQEVYIIRKQREAPRYYTMQLHQDKDCTIVSSDALPQFTDWTPLGEGVFRFPVPRAIIR